VFSPSCDGVPWIALLELNLHSQRKVARADAERLLTGPAARAGDHHPLSELVQMNIRDGQSLRVRGVAAGFEPATPSLGSLRPGCKQTPWGLASGVRVGPESAPMTCQGHPRACLQACLRGSLRALERTNGSATWPPVETAPLSSQALPGARSDVRSTKALAEGWPEPATPSGFRPVARSSKGRLRAQPPPTGAREPRQLVVADEPPEE
jgi:hypothetical protein